MADIEDNYSPELLTMHSGESQQFYKSLFNHYPDGVLLVDLDGQIRMANPASEKIMGYAIHELTTISIQQLVVSEQWSTVEHYALRAQSGETQTFETVVCHKNGREIDVRVTAVPLVIDEGVRRIHVVVQDITESKEAHAVLEESQRRLKHAQRMARLGNWEWDLRTNTLSWCEELAEIFMSDYDPKSLTFGEFISMVDACDRDKVLATIQKALQGEQYDIEFTVTDPSGRVRIVQSQGEAIFDETGMPIRVLGTVSDITERKKMERALQESEAKYRLIEENMTDMICVLDQCGTVQYASPSHATVLGILPEDYTGAPIFQYIHPHDVELTMQVLNQMREIPSPAHLEIRMLHQGGHWIDIEMRGAPILDEHENVVGFVMVGRDTSERKQSEELLRQAEKLSVVGELAAGIAHEIRNPLTSIKGFIQLFRQRSEADAAYFDIVMSELKRIEEIISEFLVMAKPQFTEFQVADIRPLLWDVISLMTSQAILTNVQIVTHFDDVIPKVYCEKNKLKQVFINILKNAIEAMPEGGTIDVSVVHFEQKIVVRIRDEGIGISNDMIPNLESPFFTTKDKGTGLGLTVSSKIIQEHQGTIKFFSGKNQGTVVEVNLPSILNHPELTGRSTTL